MKKWTNYYIYCQYLPYTYLNILIISSMLTFLAYSIFCQSIFIIRILNKIKY